MRSLDTIALARDRLRRGETTSHVLVADSLAAIDRHAASTNAFTRVHRHRALAEAIARDAELARGRSRGPLHGIPISIKDLVDEAGVVTTAGSHVLDDRIAPTDAVIVSRLREAGAIIIGRTNLHQFGFGTTSDLSCFGPVRHPADPDRSPGGSSGGSAAAVATGMGLASIGTDTGGSVRIPAAICGLVGLKPTAGEVPMDGVIPLSHSFDVVGPIAVTVQDAAWLFHVMAGREPADVPPWPTASLRLARLTGYFESPLAPDVRAAFESALARLTREGTVVDARTLDRADTIVSAYLPVARAEAAAWHGTRLDDRADGYAPAVRDGILEGRRFSAAEDEDARAAIDALAGLVDALLDEADAIVTTTVPIVAPPLGASMLVVDPATGVRLPVRPTMLKHTQLANMTGHPAVSVPLPSPGLPVGLQIVGRRHDTERLLSIAAGIAAALAD